MQGSVVAQGRKCPKLEKEVPREIITEKIFLFILFIYLFNIFIGV